MILESEYITYAWYRLLRILFHNYLRPILKAVLALIVIYP